MRFVSFVAHMSKFLPFDRSSILVISEKRTFAISIFRLVSHFTNIVENVSDNTRDTFVKSFYKF